MTKTANGVSAYLFDIDDNLLFLPTSLYLWNAEAKSADVLTLPTITLPPCCWCIRFTDTNTKDDLWLARWRPSRSG